MPDRKSGGGYDSPATYLRWNTGRYTTAGRPLGHDHYYGQPDYAGQQSHWAIGPFAGRGPRTYRPSDDLIGQEINSRLTQHGYMDARDIHVDVNRGEVTLSGKVNSRREKRLAEDIADSVRGVSDVHNQLRVNRSR